MADRLTLTLAADSSQAVAGLKVWEQQLKAAEASANRAARTFIKTGDALDAAKLGQASAALQNVAKGYDSARAAIEGTTQASEKLNTGLRLNRGGLMELQAAGVNSFQALASGMDIFRVAMTEGAQVIGALIQGGLGGFGLLAAGITAAGGALAYLASQAQTVKQTLTGISVERLLSGRGGGAGELAELDKAAEALAKKLDISKTAAAELMAELNKARTLDMSRVQQFAELAAAEGKARRAGGESVKDLDIAKEIAKAAAGGAEGLAKLGKERYNLDAIMTGIVRMAQSGDELGAFGQALDVLARHIRDHGAAWAEAKAKADQYNRSVGTIAGSMGELGAAGIAEAERVAGAAPGKPTERPSGDTGVFQDRVDRMRRAAGAIGLDIGVTSGTRTRERQQQLFDAAVEKYGSEEAARKWVAPPGTSMHEKGLAADLSFGPGAREWARANAGRFGLGFPMAHEPWHVEAVEARTGGGANAYAEKAQQELKTRLEAAEDAKRAIDHRHSLEAQLKDAEDTHARMLKDYKAGSEQELSAAKDVEAKKAALKDQGLELELARLKEESAATVDTAKKAEIAARAVEVATKGGASPTAIQSLKTEAAAAQRALTQEGIQLDVAKLRAAQQATKDPAERIDLQKQIQAASTGRPVLEQAGLKTELEGMLRQQKEEAFRQSEQGVGAMISARGDQFRGFQAQQTAAVREGRITPLQSLDAQMAKSKELADENATALNVLGAAATSNTDHIKIYWELWREGVRAATETQQLLNEKAQETKKLIDGWAAPFKSAFNSMESSISSGLSGLITGATTWGKTMTNIGTRLVEGVVDTGLNTLSKFAAKAIDATATGTLGDLAGKFIGENLLKLAPSAVADTTGVATTTAAMGTMTAATTTAMGTMTAAVATAMAAMASAVAGGEAVQATAAVADAVIPFAKGGIVPSAAGGWALPSYPGTQPALLHAKEMVLPAHISEGLQSAIGKGGGLGGGVTFNLNAVAADGPAIERLFRSNGRLITDAVKSGVRNNALTPRSI